MRKISRFVGVTVGVALAIGVPQFASAQGLLLSGSGAMNRSMAGTSSAKAVDALGALYWNPATISGLPHSEVAIGSDLIIPNVHLGSTVPAGTFGPFGPATTLSGNTRSDGGLVPTTGVGFVYHDQASPLSYGIGMVTLAGGGVNFPGDVNNPILAPTGPLNQFILGSQGASILILGILPTASYQVSDRLAIGAGPTVDVALVSMDPAFFGPTSQVRPIDPRVFPTGSHTRPFWGAGFRVGATYKVTDHLVAGIAYTSPQWFETWRFNAREANGDPLTFTTQFSLPTTVSFGVAYDGIERLLLASDVRYFDYSTTKLLGVPPAQGGAGWSSIWSVSFGARYMLNERMSVQAGYLYNENPVPDNFVLFNTQLPATTMHTISAGAFMQVNDSIGMSLAYVHGFENTITGSAFPIVGTSSTLQTSYDSIVVGLHIRFGACRGKEMCAVDAPVNP